MSTQEHRAPVDPVTGMSTTGHEWDGIHELNHPLPRWWLWLFYATILWSIGYWVVYPAWPTISSYSSGVLGWNSRAVFSEDLATLKAARAPMVEKLAATDLDKVSSDAELLDFTRAYGRAAFGDNCAPCHGSGGGGAKGYPNLVDDDWLWGGTLEAIQATITHGARNADGDSHQGNMPAFGQDDLLKPDEVRILASYARTLSGLQPAPGVDIATGKDLFAQNCAACHGEDGKGNREVGAPNLTDSIWLYDSDAETIMAGINHGRGGIMPAWGQRLDATTIKALAVYVHGLGGGE